MNRGLNITVYRFELDTTEILRSNVASLYLRADQDDTIAL